MQSQRTLVRKHPHTRETRFLLRVAIVFGAVPLAAGIAVFVAWLVTRGDLWVDLGAKVLLFGSILLFVGLIALVWHAGRAYREHSLRWLSVLGTGGLLFANLLAAAAIITVVMVLETAYVVTVVNDSTEIVHSFEVNAPGVQTELGPLAPGQKVRDRVIFAGDGVFTFRARLDESTMEGTISGYVTNGLPGNTEVRITGPGEFEVVEIEDHR